MTASIRVYDDTVANSLLFDSSKATVPVFFKKTTFTYSQITSVGSGFSEYGRVNVTGLISQVHFCFSIQSDNAELNTTVPSMTSRTTPTIFDGYLKISYELLLTLRWLHTYYPNAVYFVNILELR